MEQNDFDFLRDLLKKSVMKTGNDYSSYAFRFGNLQPRAFVKFDSFTNEDLLKIFTRLDVIPGFKKTISSPFHEVKITIFYDNKKQKGKLKSIIEANYVS